MRADAHFPRIQMLINEDFCLNTNNMSTGEAQHFSYLMSRSAYTTQCQIPISKCVVQVGVLCPERSRFSHSGENVSGLAGEAIMLCMEPLCVRMMQLASFTLSFT
jgi:hypothetical protein